MSFLPSGDVALRKMSPFAIEKGLLELAGDLKSVTKANNDSLVIECSTESHSRNQVSSGLRRDLKTSKPASVLN